MKNELRKTLQKHDQLKTEQHKPKPNHAKILQYQKQLNKHKTKLTPQQLDQYETYTQPDQPTDGYHLFAIPTPILRDVINKKNTGYDYFPIQPANRDGTYYFVARLKKNLNWWINKKQGER